MAERFFRLQRRFVALQLLLRHFVAVGVFLGWIGGMTGVFHAVHRGVGLTQELIGVALIDAQDKKRNSCSGGPNFSFVWDFGFRFPAEKLGRDEKSSASPEEHGKNRQGHVQNGDREIYSALQTIYEVG